MYNSGKAREVLAELQAVFAAPDDLVGGLTATYIHKQAGSDRPIDHWSWGNRLLVWIHQTDDARTFNQWKKVDRAVKKGSRAFYLLAPCTVKVKNDDEDDERMKVVGFRGFPVFGVDDTQGRELPEQPDYTPEDLPEFHDIAQSWGLTVKYMPGGHGAPLGSFSPWEHRIALATHEETVFYHELGHAADNRAYGQLKGGQDPQQEAVAELVAAVLARLTGKRMDKKAWSYIGAYTKDPSAMLKTVLPRVESALDEIFA